MICDSFENIKSYKSAVLEKAAAFIRSLKADEPDGRHEIDGDNIYANVMTYTTETAEPEFYEYHRKYADVQAVLTGSEALLCCDVSRLKEEHTAYDGEKDYGFLKPAAGVAPSRLEMIPGSFALFLPQDAHIGKRAGAAGTMTLKKVVVKIAVEFL